MRDHTIQRVAVIGGGANDEHDVSLASAVAVTRAVQALGLDAVSVTIDRSGRWHHTGGIAMTPAEAVAVLTSCDVAFPVLHGVNGEDGAIAGLLAMTGVPLVGSPVRAGALATDKWVTKIIAEAIGIRTAPATLIRDGADAMSVGMLPPFVVKPTTAGSSNGVSVVRNSAELPSAIDHALSAGHAALVETFVDGREVDVAVFRDRNGILHFGATLEISVAEGGVFDRAQKYDGTASFTVPARITADEHTAIEQAARSLYVTLGCTGIARFDFFVTANGVVLNEVNTAPGFTEHSQVPRMYAATGLSYVALVAALLDASAPDMLLSRTTTEMYR
jgi:D-alanine--D-alanine ligase